MITYWAVALAIVTGIMITLNRTLGAGLGEKMGVAAATFFTFLIGFVVLLAIQPLTGTPFSLSELKNVPFFAWLGVPFSLLFLALTIWLIPKLGATTTTILIITGQLLGAAALDAAQNEYRLFSTKTIGAILVVIGFYLAARRSQTKT